MREMFTIADFGIVEAGIHLPGAPRDIAEYAQAEGVDAARVEALLAGRVRWFHMDEDQSDADMIFAAIENLCARVGNRKFLAQVTYLIYVHSQAFSMAAPPESLFSALLGRYDTLRPSLSFSVEHAACASIVMAMEWAARLLHQDGATDALALVVTSDRVFGNAQWRIRQDGGVQSDGASALLVGTRGLRCCFGGVTVSTYDRLHDGPASPTNEAAIARTTWLHTRQTLREHSKLTGMDAAHAAAILPINADYLFWLKIAEALHIPLEKFYFDGITQRGHACSADLAVNLIDHGLALVDADGWILFCAQSNLGVIAALTLMPPGCRTGRHATAPGIQEDCAECSICTR